MARVDSSSFLGSPTAASEEEVVVVVPGSGAGSAELGRALMDAQAELAEKSSELAAARATIAKLEARAAAAAAAAETTAEDGAAPSPGSG